MSRLVRPGFLVTTAEESTWNTDEPILFLGEWCRRPMRHDLWQNLDAAMLPYHWDDRDKYFRDYQFLESRYERLLSYLSERLGAMHGLTTDVRHWRIIIGPWLRFFVDAIFDRYESVRSAYESGAVRDTWVLRYDLIDCVPADFQEFYSQFTGDGWNHIVFAECIRSIGLPHTVRDEALQPRPASGVAPDRIDQLATALLDVYGRVLPARLNKVVLVSGGIPKRQLSRLQCALGQLPYVKSPVLDTRFGRPDPRLRALLADHDGETPFERLLDMLIPAWIPRAYVENFTELRNTALAEFPRDPKVIATASAYQSDEGFKMWAANHAMKRVPLVVVQHGGNMGIGRFSQSEDHQLRIADVFTSWGWTREGYDAVQPMPALKLADMTVVADNRGDILITLASYPRYFYCHYCVPVAGQVLEYVHEQVRFMSAVSPEFSASLKLRLDLAEFGWDIPGLLTRAGFGASIESTRATLADRLNGCRIAVSTYNATVFLETLAANFPTLVFFDPNRFEVRAEAQPMMNRLRQVGILHDTPECAARALNTIGNDVQEWWRRPAVQRAREEFCDQYARSSIDWVGDWKSFFERLQR